MADYTALTRGGTAWVPEFVVELNRKLCIGCGRCYKVCPRDVLSLEDRDEDEIDEDMDDEELTSVMTIKNALDCIGCGACGRVCPKDCYTHSAMPVGA
jgi:Nif-specific ferredoxin III